MKKVLLINPDEIYGDPPLGLAYVASYLLKNLPETRVKILDKLSPEEIIKKAKEFSPDIVGISAVSTNYWLAKKIALSLKKEIGHALMVIGGVHVSTSRESFEKSPFDVGVVGEGELTFLEIVTLDKFSLESLSKIKGLLLRREGRVIFTGERELIKNLDDIPLPARNLLDMDYYRVPKITEKGLMRVGSIISSRGCPYNCSFCASSVFWHRKIRFFSAKRVAQEVELLYKKYGYQRIIIYDDLFTINKSRIREIVTLLEKSNILGQVEFICFGRANVFDEELAGLLKRLNVILITFGIETGSKRMLSYLKKDNVTVQQGINALKLCEKFGIVKDSFFMIGSPTETEEDIKKTYEFVKEYTPQNFIVYQTIAFPGTEIWEYALKNKIMARDYYERESRSFTGIDTRYLLSREISGEKFKEWFERFEKLRQQNRKSLILKCITPKNWIYILDPPFIKKMMRYMKKR